jgi:hypothetical protein
MSLQPYGLDRWLDEEIARAHYRHARRHGYVVLAMVVLLASYLAYAAASQKLPTPRPPSVGAGVVLGRLAPREESQALLPDCVGLQPTSARAAWWLGLEDENRSSARANGPRESSGTLRWEAARVGATSALPIPSPLPGAESHRRSIRREQRGGPASLRAGVSMRGDT